MLYCKRFWISLLSVWIGIIVIFGITRKFKFAYNVTESLPQKLWLINVGQKNLKYNDYVVFKFHDYRMKNPEDYEVIVKQIGAISNEVLQVVDLTLGFKSKNKINVAYYVDGNIYPVFDKLSNNHFTPLSDKNLTVPADCYFVHGQHQPTFDSRYKEFGLICNPQIIGKAYPIF